MGAAAFNRARRQAKALQDAQARDDSEQTKTLTERYTPEQIAAFVANNDLLGSPPYADVARLVDVPGDADLDREREAAEQAMRNRERNPTPEEIWELSNAHYRDAKVKAIPEAHEAGRDRTLKGQAKDRLLAYGHHEDPRSPTHDGRVRATEPEETRPDADTTVSPVTRQPPQPVQEDADPKTMAKIAADGEKKADKRVKAEAKVMDETAKQTARMLKDAGQS